MYTNYNKYSSRTHKLDRIKELARQISELELEDFLLVQSAVLSRTDAQCTQTPLNLNSTSSLGTLAPFMERLLQPALVSTKEAAESGDSVTSIPKEREHCAPIEDVPVGAGYAHTRQKAVMNLEAQNSTLAIATVSGVTSLQNNKTDRELELTESTMLCQRQHCNYNPTSQRYCNIEKRKRVGRSNVQNGFNHWEVANFLWKGTHLAGVWQ